MPAPLTVRPISAAEHEAFVEAQRSASFLQTPGWARVKSEWRGESLGWFDEETLVGAGLVLYRQLPKVRRYLAYLPEGPLLDWADEDLARWLDPMAAYLKDRGAFGVRIGPAVVWRRWSAQQIKDGIADESVRTLGQVTPSERRQVGASVVAQLRRLGWLPQSVEGGFAAGQPQYNFVVPLRDADGAPRTEDDVLKGMNQLWRRNIKKAAKAGVVVTRWPAGPDGEGASGADALSDFHRLYVETAARDHFTPRGAAYFEVMRDALNADGRDRFRLYAAHHEGDLVASTIWIRVGAHTWYSYGASSSEKREVRGSNAIQWQMIRDSLAAGADVYDLRGITDTLDAEDPHVGLIQFKVGTGGEAVEYPGEWDLPLNRPLYRAFALYMKRRG